MEPATNLGARRPGRARINLSDLGAPRSRQTRIDLSDLGNPVREEMHPEIGTWDRAKVMNLSPTSDVGAEYLRQKGLQVVDEGDFNYRVRRKGEKEWRRLDPKGWDLRDLLDVGGDLFTGTIAGLSGVGGAALAAPSGPGAIAGGLVGAAAGGAAASTLKSAIGSELGLPITREAAGQGMTGEALTGAVGQGLGLGINYAMKPLAKHIPTVMHRAGEAVRTAPKIPGATVRAAVGGVKALPRAAGAAAVDLGRKAVSLPAVGPFVKTVGKGMKKGWEKGMGREILEIPEETKAILKGGIQGRKNPSEIVKEASITPEMLPNRPAVRETAKKAAEGQPLSDFEEQVLGRAIENIRDPGKAILTPGEQYLEHLYWQMGAKGSNQEPGSKFFVEWARRGPGNPGGRVGDQPRDVIERLAKLRPSFKTREEVRANLADLTDDEIRQVLRDDWGIKGWRTGKGRDAERTPFKAPVPATQKRVPSGLHPLEQTTREDLEELLFRVQPEAITVGKGGVYDPRKYKLTRLIDMTKAEPFGGMSKDEMVQKVVTKLGIEPEKAAKMSRLTLRDIIFGPRKKYMGLQSSSDLGAWISPGMDDVTAVKIPVPGSREYRKLTKEAMEAMGQQMFGR